MQTNENRCESLPAPWLALGAGVACAALWVLGYMGGLGVGMTASSLLILGVGMYLCLRQICWRADSILLLTLAVLLSLPMVSLAAWPCRSLICRCCACSFLKACWRWLGIVLRAR